MGSSNDTFDYDANNNDASNNDTGTDESNYPDTYETVDDTNTSNDTTTYTSYSHHLHSSNIPDIFTHDPSHYHTDTLIHHKDHHNQPTHVGHHPKHHSSDLDHSRDDDTNPLVTALLFTETANDKLSNPKFNPSKSHYSATSSTFYKKNEDKLIPSKKHKKEKEEEGSCFSCLPCFK